MINVIKHGKETFKVTCPVCGCEFTYQAEDLAQDMFGNHHVICPDCHQVVPHDEPKKKSLDDMIIYTECERRKKELQDKEARDKMFYVDYGNPNTIWSPSANWPDCDKCPNRPDPNKPAQVGDTPCTWCPKMRPYCTNTATSTFEWPKEYFIATGPCPEAYFNSTASYKDAKIDSYKAKGEFTTDLK